MSIRPVWKDIISKWVERKLDAQRHRCILCNGAFHPYEKPEDRWHPLSTSVEHLVPVSKGGTNDEENLAISHKDCNSKRRSDDAVPYLNDIAIDGEVRLIAEIRRLMEPLT